MWLIPAPSTSSPSAPALAESNLDCAWQFQELELSAMWRGKRSAARYWRQRWKRAAWIRRLCGQMCEPSRGRHGVESWILSLAAIRVSRSATPVSVLAKLMHDTYGRTSLESLAKYNRACAFGKTSQDTSLWDSTRSPATLKQWITELRRACLRRRKPALHTNENACSSWPTATAGDSRNTRNATANHSTTGHHNGTTLCDAVWATPKESTSGADPDTRPNGTNPSSNVPTNGLLGRQAPRVSGGGRLNPIFVQWLMGFPIGWTNFAHSGIQWYPWSRLMRSSLYGLCCTGTTNART